MEPKFFSAQVKSINTENRTIDIIASTSDLDRDHERILPSAFAKNIDSFKSNPVILAAHKHRLDSGSSPVIGSGIPESIQIGSKELGLTIRFAETKLGNEYWQLYKDKHMKAFSVGFIPMEWKDDRDPKYGDIRIHTLSELLEISAVPVGCNRQALTRAKGYFDTEETVEETKDAIAVAVKEQFADLKQSFEQQFEDIKALIIANSDGLAEGVLGRDSELPGPGGAQKLSEQLKRIEIVCTKED